MNNNNSLRVLAVIPARGGSKSIPEKNLQRLGGRPLIYHCITNALKAKTLNRVIVSTDDSLIAREAEKAGAEVPFLRPAELSTDTVSLIPVIIHAVKFCRDKEGWSPDIVASIQPTSPFLQAEVIDEAVNVLLKGEAVSVATLKQVLHEHPYWMKKFENGRVLPFSNLTNESYLQRQDLPPAYIYDGTLYVRRSNLLDQWNGKDFCLGKDIRGIVSPGFGSLHIDDFIDLETARAVYRIINRNARKKE